MASKYINIEDAARRLSISVEELNRKREKGDIRAFSDRGTWKFKSEDIEELARNLEPDSGFDIPSSDIIRDNDLVLDEPTAEGSQVILEEDMGEMPTVISKQPPNEPPSSDSDVRLVVDPTLESDWKSAPAAPKSDRSNESSLGEVSDSDVRFVDASMSDVTPTPIRMSDTSDDVLEADESDDRWAGISDSDVRLVSQDDSQSSDSDVTLEEDEAVLELQEDPDLDAVIGSSDSDVTLVGADDDDPNSSDFRMSGVDLDSDGPGSDLTLAPPDEDSNIRLEEAGDDDDVSILSDVMSEPDSGLSFSSGDSGLSLDLALDSGISLGGDEDDDGLTLGADSGISLVPDEGSGLTLADDHRDRETGDATIPMMGTVGDDEDNDTSFDMPLLEDSNAEMDDDTTGVVMFDDDESVETMAFDSSEVSDEGGFDDFDDEDSFDELSDGDLDVSDDMLDEDVLEADDDAFDDEFESGESVPALAAPGMRGGAAVGVAAAEWDMVSFSLVLLSTAMMGICTLLMFDLVRSMWGFAEPSSVNGMILESLQGLIK
ncbi:helix-turn-helix domain-containing protein [Rubinisphaera margarita]|uniref:helix-turn-helix domain-containing protein n=1 Tax=Rubinisphaera margarita TaxID=2909586 RepID=UPI001EE95CB0|nr:helix-turn-helix domain-containing protein [Rubinisphaera margarita]